MRTFWMTAGLTALGLLVFPVAVMAERGEDFYKYQKKQWEHYYENREDSLEDRYHAEKDRLEDAREHALRHAPQRERDGIRRYFHDQEKALKKDYEYREEALDHQEDRHLDMLKDQYRWSKGQPGHGGIYYPELPSHAYPAPSGPAFPPSAPPVPRWEHGAAVPLPPSGRPQWGVRIGPFSFGMY